MGTHPDFLQILSPLSQCHDEPSRNSSSRLERGSFMRVEPEERVSFATHRRLLCLNEQQRVRVASSEHLPLFPIYRTKSSGLDWKIRVAFASQIRLDKINKRYKVQENRVRRANFSTFYPCWFTYEHWQTLKIYDDFVNEEKNWGWNISFLFWTNLFCKSYTSIWSHFDLLLY